MAPTVETRAGSTSASRTARRSYNAADMGLFGDMKLIGEEGIDLACLPIGDNYTMGPDDAVQRVKLLTPKQVMPMHYDTFPLIAQDAKAWAAKVQHQTQAKPVVLQPGGGLIFDGGTTWT